VHLVEHIFDARPAIHLMTARQGGAAIELARQHHPHLILLDLNLPDISGEEVLFALRSDPATAKIPIIILIADATASQIERLLGMGAADYLTKPFDVHALLAAVDKALVV